jgi:integrase
MFNWGRGSYLTISPRYGMAKPVKERPRTRDLQPEEIRTIWQRIELGGTTINGRPVTMLESTRIALKLLLLTGQRVSEVTQPPKSEFNLDERIWTIPGERTKNQRLHRLPLPKACWALIERAIELSGSSDWLFPSPVRSRAGLPAGAKPIGATAMNHALSKVLRTSDVDNVRPHDFRERQVSVPLRSGNRPDCTPSFYRDFSIR